MITLSTSLFSMQEKIAWLLDSRATQVRIVRVIYMFILYLISKGIALLFYPGTTRLFSVLMTSTQRTTLVAGVDIVVPHARRVGATVISVCGGKQQRQWHLVCRPRQLQSACFHWQIILPQGSKVKCSRIHSSCLFFQASTSGLYNLLMLSLNLMQSYNLQAKSTLPGNKAQLVPGIYIYILASCPARPVVDTDYDPTATTATYF